MSAGISLIIGSCPVADKPDVAGIDVAQLTTATIERRFSGTERYDPEEIAKDQALLIAPIALREHQLAETERQRLRAKHSTQDPALTLAYAIRQWLDRGQF
jgi:hypothetical protein